ncbi:MAG: hypothetical protein GY875_06960 [Gammaproteobacteria bacterium]|nr:hypothetical protein [Gammaproteobacteria bacterium]
MAKVTREISPQALQALVKGRQEFALLDVRALADFVKGHLWLSINVPSDSIQSRIGRFVPRLDTHIVLIDQDQGLAQTVVDNLRSIGYINLQILAGGFERWAASGLPCITGDYVLAHAFGLLINQQLATPSISAEGLMQKLGDDEDVLIVDSRDPGDYRSSTLPGSRNVPIAEMVSRIPEMVKDDATQVVVHCGGVTRAVLGAQTLLDANFPNPVMWLLEGTTGWCIAGGELCRGETEPQISSSEETIAYTIKVAQDLAAQFELVYFEPDEIEDWKRENSQRTCYLIDVRDRDEYQAGHYPGSIHVPGGELVGMTQDHIATWNARLCLIGDGQGARAEITAAWMLKNGWDDVVILKHWEDRAVAGQGDTGKADEPALLAAGKPEPEPMSSLQASVDTRQHIFESFKRDRPYRFNLSQ